MWIKESNNIRTKRYGVFVLRMKLERTGNLQWYTWSVNLGSMKIREGSCMDSFQEVGIVENYVLDLLIELNAELEMLEGN